MQIVTITKAAEMCGVRRATFRSWVDKGHVPAEAIKRFPGSRVLRFDVDELTKWVKSLHAGSR